MYLVKRSKKWRKGWILKQASSSRRVCGWSASAAAWSFYLELSKVEEAWQLEGAPLVVADPRAEEVEGEGSRHGAEELRRRRGWRGKQHTVTLAELQNPRTTFQVRAWFQKEEPSSRLNRVPPIGAPKAAATPAAAPAETKSRLSLRCTEQETTGVFVPSGMRSTRATCRRRSRTCHCGSTASQTWSSWRWCSGTTRCRKRSCEFGQRRVKWIHLTPSTQTWAVSPLKDAHFEGCKDANPEQRHSPGVWF